MITLGSRKRSLIGVAGAMLATAGLALIPLYSQSSPQALGDRVTSQEPPPVPASDFVQRSGSVGDDAALPTIADPFARVYAEPAAPRPPAHKTELRPRLPIVRAIITGERPLALIEDGRSMTIVGPGDAVGPRRVIAIRPDAILMSDGVRLSVDGR